jgi:hypothetical protein
MFGWSMRPWESVCAAERRPAEGAADWSERAPQRGVRRSVGATTRRGGPWTLRRRPRIGQSGRRRGLRGSVGATLRRKCRGSVGAGPAEGVRGSVGATPSQRAPWIGWSDARRRGPWIGRSDAPAEGGRDRSERAPQRGPWVGTTARRAGPWIGSEGSAEGPWIGQSGPRRGRPWIGWRLRNAPTHGTRLENPASPFLVPFWRRAG